MGLNIILKQIAVILAGLPLTLGIVSCALNYWTDGDVISSGVEFYTNTGLWRICVTFKSLNIETCDSINFADFSDSVGNSIRAARAMMLLGILCIAATNILGVLMFLVFKKMKVLLLAAGGSAFAAGLFFMLAMAIYVAEIKQDALDYHAAFYLDIFAWLFSWIVGGLFIGAKMVDKD